MSQESKKEVAVERHLVAMHHELPATGYVRIWQIIGDPKRGIPPVIPISRSAWWAGVAEGRYPKSVKLSERCTVWRVEDIRAMLGQEV
jgi:hypothetical protein